MQYTKATRPITWVHNGQSQVYYIDAISPVAKVSKVNIGQADVNRTLAENKFVALSAKDWSDGGATCVPWPSKGWSVRLPMPGRYSIQRIEETPPKAWCGNVTIKAYNAESLAVYRRTMGKRGLAYALASLVLARPKHKPQVIKLPTVTANIKPALPAEYRQAVEDFLGKQSKIEKMKAARRGKAALRKIAGFAQSRRGRPRKARLR